MYQTQHAEIDLMAWQQYEFYMKLRAETEDALGWRAVGSGGTSLLDDHTDSQERCQPDYQQSSMRSKKRPKHLALLATALLNYMYLNNHIHRVKYVGKVQYAEGNYALDIPLRLLSNTTTVPPKYYQHD